MPVYLTLLNVLMLSSEMCRRFTRIVSRILYAEQTVNSDSHCNLASTLEWRSAMHSEVKKIINMLIAIFDLLEGSDP